MSDQQFVTRAFITPDCRENRGADGAWEEAARRLRAEYDAILDGWDGEVEQPTLALSLLFHRPIPDETAPVIPPFFCGDADEDA